MAYEEAVRSISLNADNSVAVLTGVPGTPGMPTGTASAGNQYKAVKVTGAHQVGLASAVTDSIVGILQNKPQNAGNAATVAIRGVSKVRVSTTVTAGNPVYLAADGRGSSTQATGAIKLGVALDTATAADTLVPVLLQLGE